MSRTRGHLEYNELSATVSYLLAFKMIVTFIAIYVVLGLQVDRTMAVRSVELCHSQKDQMVRWIFVPD